MSGRRGPSSLRAAALLLAALSCASASAQDPPDAPAAAPAGNAAVQSLQAAMLSDPATRERILALQDDPLVADVLADGATMRAIQSGDLPALLADPKLRALAEHPAVRGIVEQQAR